MSKLLKVIFAASAFVAAAAMAQSGDYMAKKPYSGYLESSNGVIARSGTGLCWHTGYWTPADAVPGCDGPLAQARVTEKTTVIAPVATSEKVTFSADTFFDFDKSIVKPAGKKTLDELVEKMKGKDVEVILATGYTDAIGTVAYNLKLSDRRAAAVKKYLVSKGVPSDKIFTEGKGKSDPIATNKTAAGRAKNRRVVIEVVARGGVN